MTEKAIRVLYRKGGVHAPIYDGSLERVFGEDYQPTKLGDGRTDTTVVYISANQEEALRIAGGLEEHADKTEARAVQLERQRERKKSSD